MIATVAKVSQDPMRVAQPHAHVAPTKGNPAACTAHTRSGELCKMPAMANGKCRMHGGKSLSGVASPAYKGAGRSRVVPARWQESYTGAVDDPDLLSLRHDIAIVDASIEELEARLPDTEAEVEAFESFLATFWSMKRFHGEANDKSSTPEKRQEAEKNFFLAFETACVLCQEVKGYRVSELEIMGRTMELREQRRRLVDTETKRLTAAVQSIRVDSVKAIVWALLDILRREIPDRKLLQRIQDRFRAEFQTLAGRKL